jgi:hypothetical protein
MGSEHSADAGSRILLLLSFSFICCGIAAEEGMASIAIYLPKMLLPVDKNK